MDNPSPRQILAALFPYLKVAASYAKQIQPFIRDRPSKEGFDSIFGAALSDADLSIQTMIEVALLGTFPHLRFYGEEYEQTYNTKYFRAITLGPQDDYLITLDPIDGTRYYLDGHTNFQILLGILNRDEFAGAIALTPAQNTFCYALHGEGIWQGSLDQSFEQAEPLAITARKPALFLGWGLAPLKEHLPPDYAVLAVEEDYSAETQIPNVNGILTGELSGVVIRSGKFIDGALLAFMAQEMGCIVTTYTGKTLPPLHECSNYGRPGLIVAASEAIHRDLLAAIQATPSVNFKEE